MVDERFELISVIFRLAGNWEYNIGAGGFECIEYPFPDEQRAALAKCEHTNDYQLEISECFNKYIEHETVLYAKDLGMGFAYPFKFAMHIEKQGEQFVFISNTSSLFDDNEWNIETAEKFLTLLNKFYKDTGYAEFYAKRISYFEELSQKFYDGFYHTIDFDWYGKYVDVSNLCCVLSPSNTAANYATIVNDKIVCGMVRISSASVLIHEFIHGFANPIADKWYAENKVFKKWCDDSIDAEKMPYYADGMNMSREYVTHAYEVLYAFQHGEDWETILSSVKNLGGIENSFPYINEIYEMVLSLEK